MDDLTRKLAAIVVPNATFWADAQRVAVLSRAGHVQAAQNLLQAEPDFSAGRFASQFLFYHQDPAQIDRYRETLQTFGILA